VPFSILVNYGYEGEVLLPVEITVPANARVGSTVTLTAAAYWLVCSDVCVPEDATLTLNVPVGAQGRDDPQWAARIAEAVANIPQRQDGVNATIGAGAPARLSVSLPNASALRYMRFFPFERGVVKASEPQHARVGANGASFSLAPDLGALGEAPLAGLVVYETQVNGAWARRGVEILAEPGAPIAGTDDQATPISADYALAELEGGGQASAS
jgi:thiol:disulfide interchange protein DsbD